MGQRHALQFSESLLKLDHLNHDSFLVFSYRFCTTNRSQRRWHREGDLCLRPWMKLMAEIADLERGILPTSSPGVGAFCWFLWPVCPPPGFLCFFVDVAPNPRILCI